MAAFTSKASGNWSSGGQTTWNEVGVPGNGDTVTISDPHVITVDVDTTVGSSPATGGTAAVAVSGTTGALTVAAGKVFTIKGDITLNNAVLTLGAGATLTFDASGASSPSTTTYKVLIGTAGYQHTAKLAINGTSGSRCTVNSNSSGGNGYITNTTDSGSLVVTYCDFTRVGDATNPAVRANAQQDSGIDLQHCTFTSCGKITHTGNPGATITYRFLGVTTKSTVASLSLDGDTGTTVLTSGVRLIQDCIFDKTVQLLHVLNITMTNCLLTGLTISNDNATGWASFTGNLIHRTVAGASSLLGGDVSNCYVVADDNTADHMVSIGSDNRDQTISGCVFEMLGTTDTGDCILMSSLGAAHTITVSHNIKLPNGADDTSGPLISALGNANVTISAIHNTVHLGSGGSPENVALRCGETYNAHAGMFSKIQNNLGWDSSVRGYLAGDVNGAPNTDVVTSANCDYNGKYNQSGTGYTGFVFSSGSPGAHDVTGDPQFVDSARDIAKWDQSLGGAGTATNAIAELSKLNDAAGYNTAYTIAALLTYVKAGFAPQNTSYQAANDSVSPSNGWIGAVEGVLSGPHGRVLIDTVSPTQLPDFTCAHVRLRACLENTDYIAIGGSGVTTDTGYQLFPGDMLEHALILGNTNLIYAIAATSGQYLEYITL